MNQLEIYQKLRQLHSRVTCADAKREINELAELILCDGIEQPEVIPAGFTKVNRQVTDKNVLWSTIEYDIDYVKRRLNHEGDF
jgi:hypothetical protein